MIFPDNIIASVQSSSDDSIMFMGQDTDGNMVIWDDENIGIIRFERAMADINDTTSMSFGYNLCDGMKCVSELWNGAELDFGSQTWTTTAPTIKKTDEGFVGIVNMKTDGVDSFPWGSVYIIFLSR